MRRNIDTALEEGRHRALSVQRVRTLPQDERDEQTPDKTVQAAGKSLESLEFTLHVDERGIF